jgi:hypothetical protein
MRFLATSQIRQDGPASAGEAGLAPSYGQTRTDGDGPGWLLTHHPPPSPAQRNETPSRRRRSQTHRGQHLPIPVRMVVPRRKSTR